MEEKPQITVTPIFAQWRIFIIYTLQAVQVVLQSRLLRSLSCRRILGDIRLSYL